MTPAPSSEELNRRHVYDPAPSTVHVRDLINMAKDGLYNKDILSDHLIGVLDLAKDLGVVKPWELGLFQVPFASNGTRIRSTTRHVGRPFLDPDGNIMTLGDRCLHGDNHKNFEYSLIGWGDITAHSKYNIWVKKMLYAKKNIESTSYIRAGTLNTKKAIDDYVNSRPYTPGPKSVAPENIAAEVSAAPRNLSRPRSDATAGRSGRPDTSGMVEAPRGRAASRVQTPELRVQDVSREQDMPGVRGVAEEREVPAANQVSMTFEVRNISSLSFNLDLSGEPTFTLKYTLKPPEPSA